LCFEPHAESRSRLREIYDSMGFGSFYKIFPHALSGTAGERTLYLTNEPTGSSILPVNSNGWGMKYVRPSYYFPMREEKIQTHRLESVLTELNEPKIDIIKLDTQGSELEILEGLGSKYLDGLILAELEVPLHDCHLGQSTFPQVQEFMERHGLELMDLKVARSYRPREGNKQGYQNDLFGVYRNSPGISARAWEFDAIYFRKPESLLKLENPAQEVRKQVVAYCAYNFYSEAIYLIELAKNSGVLVESEFIELRKSILLWHRKIWYRFWQADAPFQGWIRTTLKKWRFGQRWSQYIWLEYPDS